MELYITLENYTNGYKVNILDFIFIASIICGILVITSKNPIVSVLFLIGLFLNIACYLLVLGTNFIGLAYLLVYVGAVSILFLFILMLINIRVSELTGDTSNSIPLALIISFIFYSILYNIIPNNLSEGPMYNIEFGSRDSAGFNLKNELHYVTSKLWDGNLSDNPHINTLGNIMYTNYFIWLILSSIILLLAMVGAIIITIKEK
jgi:NADH-ubiquinone oxidoreductase chain 6